MRFPAADRYRLRAVWLRSAEPVPEIAERLAEYVGSLSDQFGVESWRDTFYKREWPASPSDQEAMVAAGVYVEDDDSVHPLKGYSVTLAGMGVATGVQVRVHAGTAGIGGGLPVDYLDVIVRAKDGDSPDADIVDPLFSPTIRAWEPVMVSFTTYELQAERWGIDVGWRLWLRNDVGSFTTIADGLTAVEMEGGTLLKAPEEWSADQVSDAVGSTLAANGLTEIPRDEQLDQAAVDHL